MTSKAPISNSMVVKSRPSAAIEVYRQILSKLEGKGFSQDNIFAVHLALEEAFSNAVRHGNKMNPSKEVKIDYSVSLDKVEVSVTDEGDGFDPTGVPDPRYGENLYRPGGRGLFLMHSYMDEIGFNERGNRVCLVKYKEKPPLTKSQGQTKA